MLDLQRERTKKMDKKQEAIDILKEYQSKPNVHIEYGINLGYKKSFMTLLIVVT